MKNCSCGDNSSSKPLSAKSLFFHCLTLHLFFAFASLHMRFIGNIQLDMIFSPIYLETLGLSQLFAFIFSVIIFAGNVKK